MIRKILLACFVFVLVALPVTYFFGGVYLSSGGYAPYAALQEFSKRVPKCYGLSILLNPGAVMADAGGQSLCVGFLDRNRGDLH